VILDGQSNSCSCLLAIEAFSVADGRFNRNAGLTLLFGVDVRRIKADHSGCLYATESKPRQGTPGNS